tara:strand:+ start:204 stop:557 length:354 start_codon:yes stop_codon:yes gene_type:complete
MKKSNSWLKIAEKGINYDSGSEKNKEKVYYKKPKLIDINEQLYDDEWDIYNEEFGNKIFDDMCNMMPYIREKTYIADHINAGEFYEFFMQHINVLDNIENTFSNESISSFSSEEETI